MTAGDIPYKHLRKRLRRSFYYAPGTKMDQLTFPLTEAANGFFDDSSPFDYLDLDFASRLSKEGCVHPCSLIVALVYLDRLRQTNKDTYEASDPNDLYLAALLVSSKFLNDEGEEDCPYNDEWAASCKKPLKHVNEKEVEFLFGIEWNLMVKAAEFYQALDRLEADVANRETRHRKSLTYTELDLLSRALLGQEYIWSAVLQPLLSAIGLASLLYSSAVFSLYYGTLVSSSLPSATFLPGLRHPSLTQISVGTGVCFDSFFRPCPNDDRLDDSLLQYHSDDPEETVENPTMDIRARNEPLPTNRMDAAMNTHNLPMITVAFPPALVSTNDPLPPNSEDKIHHRLGRSRHRANSICVPLSKERVSPLKIIPTRLNMTNQFNPVFDPHYYQLNHRYHSKLVSVVN